MLEFENKIQELAQRLGSKGFVVSVDYILNAQVESLACAKIEMVKEQEVAIFEVYRHFGGLVSYQRVF